MPNNLNTIEYVKGNKPDLFVIAPHGVKQNDINTDLIARTIVSEIGCSALINDQYTKKQCDYNLKKHAENDPEFKKNLKKLASSDGPTLVIWVHGADDSSVKGEAENDDSEYGGKPEDLHALIGYGQGYDPSIKEADSHIFE